MESKLLSLLRDLVQYIILEYLDYKLRCRKYIKQLPKDLLIYKCILDRPEVEEVYYCNEDYSNNSEFIFEYKDDEGFHCYFGDEFGNESYFAVTLVTNFFKRKYWTKKTIEISYAYSDRNTFKVEQNMYDYDYDGSRHRI